MPLGLAYAAMIPIPCYFERVNRIRWLHALRNAVFAVVAVTCFGIGIGWVPRRLFGI